MSVLALLLAGPLQSWGSSARFARRTTEDAPTKSGIIGLLAAAHGRPRTADLADLRGLRFGVRVDQRGTRVRDYQTAHHGDTGQAMPVSERFYLADAVFVAAVEGPEELVGELHQAVRRPEFLPYLGRRSCPPGRPLDLGVHSGTVEEALRHGIAWQAADWYQRRRGHEAEVWLETIVDTTAGADSVRDLPLSFDPLHRRYALRGITRGRVRVRNPRAADSSPNHDPMSPLRGD